VCFHEPLECWRYGLHLNGSPSIKTIVEQGPIAEFSQSQSALGGSPTAHIFDAPRHTGLCLKQSGQRVPHSSHQKTNRTPGNHGGINQHEIRISTIKSVSLEDSLLAVYHRQCTARCVAGSNGWTAYHWQAQVGGRSPPRIESFAAASSY